MNTLVINTIITHFSDEMKILRTKIRINRNLMFVNTY